MPNSGVHVVTEHVVQLLLQHLRLAAFFETAACQRLTQCAFAAAPFGRRFAHIPGECGSASERTHNCPPKR